MYIFPFTVVRWPYFEQSSRVLGNLRAFGPEQELAAGPVFEQPVCQGSLSVETPRVSSNAWKFLTELIWCFCFTSLKDGRKTWNTIKLCPVLSIVYRWKSPGSSLVRTVSGDSSQVLLLRFVCHDTQQWALCMYSFWPFAKLNKKAGIHHPVSNWVKFMVFLPSPFIILQTVFCLQIHCILYMHTSTCLCTYIYIYMIQLDHHTNNFSAWGLD